jgi:hypothetical protein
MSAIRSFVAARLSLGQRAGARRVNAGTGLAGAAFQMVHTRCTGAAPG